MFTSKQPPIEGSKLVHTVYNPVEAAIIEDLLKQADIPSMRCARHRLDPLPVLAGFSALGEEIYVSDAHVEEARAIISAFTQGGSEIIYDDEPNADA